MDPKEFCSKLPGVVGFPITPFHADLSLDLDGLRSNVASMLEQPFTTIVAAGGTGEMYSLTNEEHVAVVKAVVEAVDGKIPVIAGTGFNRATGAELARQSAAVGASAILAFPPYYPGAHFDGLFDYYKAIGDATSLGLMIYSRDWAKFSPAQVEKLTEIENFVCWKEGLADIRAYQMIMNRIGDRLYWIGGAGDDMVPAYYALGIRTYTSSISNVAPKLSIHLHETAAARDDAKLNELIREYVTPLYEFRTRRKGYEVSAMKAMMDMIGLKGGPSRAPVVDVLPDEMDALRALVEKWRPFL
ncbi:MAG: 5-dehydro-4-deoxyglucarate dehydratase [Candidatus Binatia bacterium]|jgi:5-dehydro-4-deoxyglucarate dehydratase